MRQEGNLCNYDVQEQTRQEISLKVLSPTEQKLLDRVNTFSLNNKANSINPHGSLTSIAV